MPRLGYPRISELGKKICMGSVLQNRDTRQACYCGECCGSWFANGWTCPLKDLPVAPGRLDPTSRQAITALAADVQTLKANLDDLHCNATCNPLFATLQRLSQLATLRM